MDITSIASTALVSASSAVDQHAYNVVNSTTPDFAPWEPTFSPLVTGGVAFFTQESSSFVNPFTETLGMITASDQYKAAASLINRDNEMQSEFFRAVNA